jgi:hypothetical protein
MSKNVMQDFANHIENTLGEEYGFFLMVYKHTDSGRANYVSNSQREDVIEAMKEFIEKSEGAYGAHKL